MLVEMKITEFADTLASLSPAPGGGSVAALAGTLGAALGQMVSALTLKPGRKTPPTESEVLELQEAMTELSAKRQKLTELIDEDTEAFNEYMSALALPKATDDEKSIRRQAMQKAMQHALLVPLETARLACSVLPVLARLAVIGNKQAISDVGVGALMIEAAVRGAVYNVRINLGSIKDEELVDKTAAETLEILKTTKAQAQLVLTAVELEL